MAAELLVVAQKQGRTVRLGQDDIEIAIAVDIGESGAAADDGLEEIGSGLVGSGHGESAAVVPEELGRLLISLACLDFADLLLEMSVGGQQVEAAIQIVVEE